MGRKLYHGIPDELDHLIDELLAKDPAKRPASALAVGRRLTAIGDMLSQTQLPTHDGIGDSSPSLIIQSEADPAAPTNHDRSSSLTKATTHKNAPQASPSSIDLLAETMEGTGHGSSHALDTSLDATTELPKSVLEPTDTGSNQEPPQVTSFATQHLEQSADEPSVVDSDLPLEHRPTKQATSSSDKSTTSDADEDPNSTVVDNKPARRFITVEESERAAHQKNAQHRWQRIRIDTLVTAATVVLGIGITYWIIRPQSADQLFQTITIEMQKAEPDLLQVLSRRLRRLNSGIGILRVGGATEAEIGERKDRVEDALYATKAAMQEGVVVGGGSLLAKLAKKKMDTGLASPGAHVVYRAACEPLRQIANNCGSVPDVILEKIGEKPDGYGYNGIDGTICNLLDAGIIDPTRVTRLALQNASSVSINLLSIGCSMVEDSLTSTD